MNREAAQKLLLIEAVFMENRESPNQETLCGSIKANGLNNVILTQTKIIHPSFSLLYV